MRPSVTFFVLSCALAIAGCSFPTGDFRLVPDSGAAPDIVDRAQPPDDQTMPPPDTGPAPDNGPAPDTGPAPDMAPPDVTPPSDVADVTDAADAGPQSCSAATPCAASQACCNGRCVDTQSDAMNCGACGTACTGGTSCCTGRCISTAADNTHCGRCNNVCDPPNAAPACAAGVCGVGPCDMGYGNCDMNAANGCETPLSADPMNCGRCGMRCPSAPNSMPTCSNNTCGLTCSPGFENCDGNAVNGCETDLRTSTANCGRCRNACAAGPNATATCSSGTCRVACSAGFEDCNENPADGCEVNVATSVSNCGGCGVTCSFPNAVNSACNGGACGLGLCNGGFANCDGVTANGCETATTSDPSNCGACRAACLAGSVCQNSRCVTSCNVPPLMMCGATCVDTSNNASHCGGCGRACNATNGTASCVGGACRVACNPGFADCNNSPADGCEVNLNADVRNCGGCGMSCGTANGTASCVSGACRITCNAGFANCDNDAADGCEVNTGTSVNDCGMCGRVCSLPNASPVCAAGACAVGSCASGFGNCDGSAANGCETRVNTATHCGACGRTCAATQICAGTTCTTVTICPAGTTRCGSACVNTATDESNCGACGRACGRGFICSASRCVPEPPPNDRCADATVIPITAGVRVNVTANVTNANHDLDSPCFGAGGPDVFFRFTLTRRELVYADTFGATWDTRLFFATSCTAPLTTRTSGDNVCDENQGLGCTTAGLTSQVFTVLDAGTYYLVLSSTGTPGTATVHFEHLPVGSGTVAPLLVGTTTRSGTTSGTGAYSGSTCGGTGPEHAYWWVTCPNFTGGAFNATTCTRATWNTVLNVLNGSGTGDACNNDSCGLQSSLSATIPAGAGLHALIVDGFSSASGAYSVLVNRP